MLLTLVAKAIRPDLAAGIFNHIPLLFSFFQAASDTKKYRWHICPTDVQLLFQVAYTNLQETTKTYHH